MLQFARKTSESAAAFWIFDLSMIFSENRYTLSRIMLYSAAVICANSVTCRTNSER